MWSWPSGAHWLNSVRRRSGPDGCLRRSAGPAPPHTAFSPVLLLSPPHTHLPAPPLYPGLQGSLGPSSFRNLASSTILISSLRCGFLSLRLTFHHRVSICVLASKTCWHLSPFECVPCSVFCFYFWGAVPRLDLPYIIKTPIMPTWC